jgi:ElaB/YqjD/DUF883 family membrane-anchored ribosome-binding protein
MSSRNHSAVASNHIDELRTLILEAEQALSNAGEAADEKLGEIKDRLQSAMQASKSTFHRIRRSAVDQAKRADDAVRSHPYESIGIALAAGLVIGWAVSKRR